MWFENQFWTTKFEEKQNRGSRNLGSCCLVTFCWPFIFLLTNHICKERETVVLSLKSSWATVELQEAGSGHLGVVKAKHSSSSPYSCLKASSLNIPTLLVCLFLRKAIFIMSFNRSNKTMYTMYNTSQSLMDHGPSWTQNYFGPPGTIKDSLRPSQTILNHVGPSTNCLRSYWIIWDQLGQSETILNLLSLGLVPFLTSPDWMVGWLSPAGRRYRAPYTVWVTVLIKGHIHS